MAARRHLVLHGEPASPSRKRFARATYRFVAPGDCKGAGAPSIHDTRMGSIARPFALRDFPSRGRQRFRHALAIDQTRIFQGHCANGAAFGNAHPSRRARHLAATLLGTPHSRRSGFRRARGLCSHQSRQAWARHARRGLAVFDVPSARRCGRVSARLGGWPGIRDCASGIALFRALRRNALRLLRPTCLLSTKVEARWECRVVRAF